MTAEPARSLVDDVSVRRIRFEDVAGFHDCLDAVARERRFLAQVEAPPFERVRGFVVDTIEKGLPQFVAVHDRTVVGWCDILPREYTGCDHCGVLGMGLLPAYRGRGLGQRLAEATMEAARTLGITRVELEVFSSNTAAVSLYRRLGFEEEGRKRRARIIDDQVDDIFVMAHLTES